MMTSTPYGHPPISFPRCCVLRFVIVEDQRCILEIFNEDCILGPNDFFDTNIAAGLDGRILLTAEIGASAPTC